MYVEHRAGRLTGMYIPDVPIRDESIRLGQFIKLASLVETGGIAKELIADGFVYVDGEADTRRGRTLRGGEVVTIVQDGETVAGARVVAAEQSVAAAQGVAEATAGDDDLGEYFDEATADDDFDPEKWRNM